MSEDMPTSDPPIKETDRRFVCPEDFVGMYFKILEYIVTNSFYSFYSYSLNSLYNYCLYSLYV